MGFKTITKGDVTITLFLNDSGAVNLYKKMDVDYPGIEDKMRSMYPTAGEINNQIGTIEDQFEYIAASRAFDEIYHRRRIGERIKQLREESGLSQGELAEKTGLKQPNIARIESGKYSTGQDILSKIAEVLGRKLDIV